MVNTWSRGIKVYHNRRRVTTALTQRLEMDLVMTITSWIKIPIPVRKFIPVLCKRNEATAVSLFLFNSTHFVQRSLTAVDYNRTKRKVLQLTCQHPPQPIAWGCHGILLGPKKSLPIHWHIWKESPCTETEGTTSVTGALNTDLESLYSVERARVYLGRNFGNEQGARDLPDKSLTKA